MKFYGYLREGQTAFATEDDFIKWIERFPKSGRAPKGKKKEFGQLKFLIHQAESYKKYGLLSWDNISNTLSWTSKEEFEKLFLKDRVEEIKIGNVTYLNTSPLAEKTFEKKSKAIAKLLKSFKGFHKKALQKSFKVVFKSSTQMRPRAKYKSQLDEIWVRHNAKVDNELYGHLLYIIVHELGHRYEKFHGLPNGWRDTYTTDYSRKQAFAASEAFAELFAISHWPNQYKQYEEQIKWFKGIMK
jgi:hypothetical protein